MCKICDELITEMRLIRQELKAMPCGKEKLKHPHRKHYWQTYYQKNRDAKLAAANARNKQCQT